ncbi:MAG: hypothetical protein AB7I59_29355 [Geminicoccaceae bacterium]
MTHPLSLAGQATVPSAPTERVGKDAPPTIADDLLRGADEIAEFVFGSKQHRRKVYYLTGDARTRMPHFRIGSVLCARKSTLLTWIERQEGQQ